MSNYPPPGYPQTPGYPTPGYPPPQPRGGCGGCLGKFLIFLGVIFLLLIILCCGGFFYLKSGFTDQPVATQKISDEIVSLNLPATLEPVAGGRLRIPFTGKTVGQEAVYLDKNHTSILVLAEMGDAFDQQFKDWILQFLESGLPQKQLVHKNENEETLKDVTKSKRERTIQGGKAVFDITEGIGVQSNKKKIRVQGAFKGKTGPALFILDADEDTLSREEVGKMIDSMN